jgi:hypothetical protein
MLSPASPGRLERSCGSSPNDWIRFALSRPGLERIEAVFGGYAFDPQCTGIRGLARMTRTASEPVFPPKTAKKARCEARVSDRAPRAKVFVLRQFPSLSLQVVEYVETVVFVTVPPNELSPAQTGFAPGTVLYGPTSCDSLNAYLTIKP